MNYTELCEKVTASIVDVLETNEAETWSAPWHRIGAGWAPRNAKTGQWYGGSNVINLACEALGPSGPYHESFSSPFWATYKQWTDIGRRDRIRVRSRLLHAPTGPHRSAVDRSV